MKTKLILASILIVFTLNAVKAQQDENCDHKKKWDPVTELQLTPEQETQFNALKETKRSSMKELRTEMQGLQKAYHMALKDHTVPKEKLYTYIDEMTALESNMKKLHVDFMFALRDVLTPEQYVKFMEHHKNQHHSKDKKKDHHKSSQPNKINQ
jgi:Spy/CpxP family protein refolding chaperone